MSRHFDIVIIGAGMVGASFAAMLLAQAKSQNLRIAIIEASEFRASSVDRYQPSFDDRATALALGSAQIYQQLSLWEKLQGHAQPIEHIHVSDKGRFGAARLNAETENVPALGFVIENKWLGEVLYEHIEQHPDSEYVTIYSPANVESIKRADGRMHVAILAKAESINICAKLVVMADGGRSSLREAMGIHYSEQPYQQFALVCNIELDRGHKNIAYERFTDTGPMALLPLTSLSRTHRCGLIWTIEKGQIEAMLALDDKAFLTQLQERFGYRAGRFIKVGERVSYPLKLQSVSEQVRQGVVIVGNAAHTLHPIAGQGFNLALRGVAALAEQLISALRNDISIDNYAMLNQYRESQRSDQFATIGFSDKSMKLFTSTNPLLVIGRNFGLQLLDITAPAKTLFARSAMGLTSDMPNLQQENNHGQ